MSAERHEQRIGIGALSWWAGGYAWRRPTLLGAVILSRVAGIALDLLNPWPMVILVDYALRGKKMPAGFAVWVTRLMGGANPADLVNLAVLGTVLLFLFGWWVGLANGYSMLCLRQRMNYGVAADVFSKLQQLSLQFHARAAVAENMRRVTSDATCASALLLDSLLPAFASVFSLAAIIGILWRLDPTLALMSFAVVPYMLLVLRRFNTPLKRSARDLRVLHGFLHSHVERSFSAIPAVQAFGREGINVNHFRQIARDVLKATLLRSRIELQFTALIGFATAAGTAGILWIGGRKALVGTVSVGAIIAFLSYLRSLYGLLEGLLQTGPNIHDAGNRATYIWEVLQSDATLYEKRGARKLQVAGGHVRFEDVTFGYEERRPVLHDVQFEVLPGQTIALVGATGSGKTTIVSLVARFADPWRGAVFIDGQDLRDVQLKSLRNNIGFVLQDPFLFPISIAENIAYGNPRASRDEIEAAARAANADEFISRLGQGYDTVVGERGATLSGGERQRISIARALLKNSPILILDEPTSALDTETERGLLLALKHLTEKRTTFVIAHRLSTIRNADLILVLEQGCIAERGTHEELMAQGGAYAQFYRLQSEQQEISGPVAVK